MKTCKDCPAVLDMDGKGEYVIWIPAGKYKSFKDVHPDYLCIPCGQKRKQIRL